MATKTTKKEEQDIWCLLMEELNTTWCILARKRKKKINPESYQAASSNNQFTEHVSIGETESVKSRLWKILPGK